MTTNNSNQNKNTITCSYPKVRRRFVAGLFINRMGRLHYLALIVFSLVFYYVGWHIAAECTASRLWDEPYYWFFNKYNMFTVSTTAILAITIIINHIAIFRRLHDIGWPGILGLFYIATMAFLFFCGWDKMLDIAFHACLIPWIFIPGTRGPNKYDPTTARG